MEAQMTFHWEIRQFKTVDEFAASLPNPVPVWSIDGNKQPIRPTGITIHHSFIPTLQQWRGKSTMIGTGNFYRDTRGWSAGPHLFVAIGSPNPANDGIWQGTPIQFEGIHAGECNKRNVGIEVVGDYNKSKWSDKLEHVMLDIGSMLLIWMGNTSTQSENHTHGHRECHSPKTCPGSAIDMNDVRTKIKVVMARKEINHGRQTITGNEKG